MNRLRKNCRYSIKTGLILKLHCKCLKSLNFKIYIAVFYNIHTISLDKMSQMYTNCKSLVKYPNTKAVLFCYIFGQTVNSVENLTMIGSFRIINSTFSHFCGPLHKLV